MDEFLDQIGEWFEQGRSVALATVIKTWGSSPRAAGSMMAISDQGEISGSVSGGCVESAVIEAAFRVLAERTPQRMHFGVANEQAWEVGLSCGGEIEVFVRNFTADDLFAWRDARGRRERFCHVLVIAGEEAQAGAEWHIFENGEILKTHAQPDPPAAIKEAAAEAVSGGSTALIRDTAQIGEAFLQVVDPPRQLILVGGVHIAIPLASLAATLGFDVVVVDPRRLFGTAERFPAVKELLQEWPQEAFKKITLTRSTAVVMLTHDPKIDDPALNLALESAAFYIGALGSVKTHQERLGRLTSQGLDPQSLNRIHGPVGLRLGASSPEEIALAIMAEIIQVWHHRN